MTDPLPEQQPVVLAADDDEDILDLVKFRLERSGYVVLQARDGQEAIVLGDDLWRTTFAADPSIVGRSLHLDGGIVTVGRHVSRAPTDVTVAPLIASRTAGDPSWRSVPSLIASTKRPHA